MTRLGTAFRLFFRALADPTFAEQGHRLLDHPASKDAAPPDNRAAPSLRPAPAPAAPPKPLRSDALTLLSVLQREARLIDFLKEDIAPYADAQVGAAVRDVHRDAAAALERLFALKPVMSETEGSQVQAPAGADAGRIRLIGNVTGQPPYRGMLRHAGWQASQCNVPEWSGTPALALIIAAAEIELPA